MQKIRNACRKTISLNHQPRERAFLSSTHPCARCPVTCLITNKLFRWNETRELPLESGLQETRTFSTGSFSCSQVFHDIAYKAKDRQDLIAGIDEFLDEVIVLPPGEWDPAIRIEPPKSLPSSDKRYQRGTAGVAP